MFHFGSKMTNMKKKWKKNHPGRCPPTPEVLLGSAITIEMVKNVVPNNSASRRDRDAILFALEPEKYFLNLIFY